MEILFVNQAEIDTPLTDEQLFELYNTCYDKIMSQDLAQEVALAKLFELYWQVSELTPKATTYYDDDGLALPSILEQLDKHILEYCVNKTDIKPTVYAELWHRVHARYQTEVKVQISDETKPGE